MSLYDNAALVCIPSGYKAGTLYSVKPNTAVGDFTVVRAGDTATRINSDLEIEGVDANIPRLNYFTASGCPQLLAEPERTNLLGYSESFGHSDWTKSGATIEGDASTAGVELITSQNDRDFSSGTTGNWSLVIDGNGTLLYDGTNPTGEKVSKLTVGSTGTYVVSRLSTSQITGGFIEGLTYKITVDYYLTSGSFSVINIGTSGVGNESLNYKDLATGQWHTITFYFRSNGAETFIQVKTNGGNTGDILYFDNISVKEVQGFPCPMVDENGDNTLQGYKLVESSGGTTHYIELTSNITGLTSGNPYSSSFYIKSAGRQWVVVGNSNGAYVYFDILNGVKGTEVFGTGDITAMSDGWYKVSTSRNYTSIVTKSAIYLSDADYGTAIPTSYTGDGTSGVYIYGAQLETGSTATSYIRSEAGGTVTRSADAVSLTDLQTNNILGTTTGTIVFEVDAGDATGSDTDLWLFEDTGSGNELALRYNADETWQWYDHHSTELIGTASTSSSTKIAITWSGTAAIISKDGASEVITLSAAFDAITDVSIGASAESANIKLMYMGDTYMSAANLNILTTP